MFLSILLADAGATDAPAAASMMSVAIMQWGMDRMDGMWGDYDFSEEEEEARSEYRRDGDTYLTEEEIARASEVVADVEARRLASDELCPICLGEFRELPNGAVARLTGCGHLFCASCLRTWLLGRGRACPTCKDDLVARWRIGGGAEGGRDGRLDEVTDRSSRWMRLPLPLLLQASSSATTAESTLDAPGGHPEDPEDRRHDVPDVRVTFFQGPQDRWTWDATDENDLEDTEGAEGAEGVEGRSSNRFGVGYDAMSYEEAYEGRDDMGNDRTDDEDTEDTEDDDTEDAEDDDESLKDDEDIEDDESIEDEEDDIEDDEYDEEEWET